ncbi:MAG: polyprenol phosphomannose-dependent alpha 1,6 mannosyltransferase MptB, partial [Pseudonocardia sp.]
WTGALGTPNAVRSWMSMSTGLGVVGGWIGSGLGLGDHTTSVLMLARTVGLVAAGGVCLLLLWRCWRGRMEPLAGLGVGLGAVVLLGPVVHPWYLLWAAIPLAASATHPAFRTTATAASAWLAVMVGPTGSDFLFRAWVVPAAIVAAAVALVVPLLLVRGRTPRCWRHCGWAGACRPLNALRFGAVQPDPGWRPSFASPGEAGKIESSLVVSGGVHAASPAVRVRSVMAVS